MMLIISGLFFFLGSYIALVYVCCFVFSSLMFMSVPSKFSLFAELCQFVLSYSVANNHCQFRSYFINSKVV